MFKYEDGIISFTKETHKRVSKEVSLQWKEKYGNSCDVHKILEDFVEWNVVKEEIHVKSQTSIFTKIYFCDGFCYHKDWIEEVIDVKENTYKYDSAAGKKVLSYLLPYFAGWVMTGEVQHYKDSDAYIREHSEDYRMHVLGYSTYSDVDEDNTPFT